jgi:hypothetical protein
MGKPDFYGFFDILAGVAAKLRTSPKPRHLKVRLAHSFQKDRGAGYPP